MKRLRIAALLLCVAVLMAALPIIAVAEEPALQVSQTAGRRGDEVEITVSLREIIGIASGGLNVVYDSDALTLLSAETGAALTGTSAIVNTTYTASSVRLTFAGTNALSQAGEVLSLRFRINSSASFGLHAVTLANVKLMDVDSQVVLSSGGSGGVSVQSISVGLSSTVCTQGQDASLDLSLSGELLPSGGELELHYDTACLSAAAVQNETAIGGTPITLLSNVDTEKGIIHISWMAVNPIAVMGKLCSLAFTAGEGATGSTEVTFADANFFDENGRELELNATEKGTISIEEATVSPPMLYMLGGQRASDGTATVRLVMDGAEIVCGGSMVLNYDESLCTPIAVASKSDAITTNPADVLNADGQLALAWAHLSPPQEKECLIEIQFTMLSDTASPLEITDVDVNDKNGDALAVEVYSGKIGITGELQKPIVSMADVTSLTGVLLDAELCDSSAIKDATIIMAYFKDGQFLSTEIIYNQIVAYDNGVYCFNLTIAKPKEADQLKLFLVQTDGSFAPVSENYTLQFTS